MKTDTMSADMARVILDAFFEPCDECDGAGHYLCPNCGDDPGEACDEEHNDARHVTCEECDGRGYARADDVGDPCDDIHDLAASVVALHAQLAQVTAERDALRAIVEGRTAPPTWQEIERHHESGGSWMASAGGVADVSEHASVTRHWADDHRELPDMGGCRWWPLDTHGRPCAWPVVDR